MKTQYNKACKYPVHSGHFTNVDSPHLLHLSYVSHTRSAQAMKPVSSINKHDLLQELLSLDLPLPLVLTKTFFPCSLEGKEFPQADWVMMVLQSKLAYCHAICLLWNKARDFWTHFIILFISLVTEVSSRKDSSENDLSSSLRWIQDMWFTQMTIWGRYCDL